MTDNQIVPILERLARIETKLDDMVELRGDIKAIRTDCPIHRSTIADHRARLTALEEQRLPKLEDDIGTIFNRLWWAVGLVIAAVVGFVIDHVLGRR